MRVVALSLSVLILLIPGCPVPPAGDCPAAGPVELGVEIAIPNEGANHSPQGTQLTYAANPPASGPHWPSPALRGFYEAPLDEEFWVHNLEHGYIVVLFDCNGPCDPALLDQLRALPGILPDSQTFGYEKVVITPYDCLPSPALLTLVAWDVQLHLDHYDEAVILDFYNRYLDHGPELAR